MKRFGMGAASTTEPGQRMAKTYGELQIWKRQLVKADNQLRSFEASTQQLTTMLDITLHAYPRVWQHTSLGNNDGHLPQELASLPVPTTPPATFMTAEATKELTARIQGQTHEPLDAWHKRYGELKVAMVPLEASRKHYEQACGELIKAQAYQQKVAGKKGPEAASALDGGITEKEALRQERWGKYLELEEQTYQKAALLAEDAHGAQHFFSAAMDALAAAFGTAAQQYAELNGSTRVPAQAQPAAAAPPISPKTTWGRKSAGPASPVAANTSSPATSSHGGSFTSASTYSTGPVLPAGKRGAAQEQEWLRRQQQEEQAGAGGHEVASPVVAGPAIAAVDLPLHQQQAASASPGTASSTAGTVSPEHQAWQPPVPASHRYREHSPEQSPAGSHTSGQHRPPPPPQQQAQRAQHRYGDYVQGATAAQEWSPPRHGPSFSTGDAQGDLPVGANMLRAGSAPSPDGPATTGYTRPAKLPARLPVRDSSYKGSGGTGGSRAPANGSHSRRASETSEVANYPVLPESEARSPEVEGSHRYPPQ